MRICAVSILIDLDSSGKLRKDGTAPPPEHVGRKVACYAPVDDFCAKCTLLIVFEDIITRVQR